jgi:HD-GYP domain-containing protein (c-di-GMP phosphodiesterase class II)
MFSAPQDANFFEIKKALKIDGTAPPRETAGSAVGNAETSRESGGLEELLESLPSQLEAEVTAQEAPDSIISNSLIFNKFNEFVESGIFNASIFKESIRQAAQNATTSIWSILKKTLDEEGTVEEEDIVTFLVVLMKVASNFTFEHSQRVMEWSSSLARELGIAPDQVDDIRKAALFRDIGETGIFFAQSPPEEKERVAELLKNETFALRGSGEFHDIGKLKIPSDIVNKTSALTGEEYEIMKQHPVIGEALLRPIKCLRPILPAVRHHHERWDGRGYPDGIAGIEIPIEARIVGLVDSFDAMISNRPYRKALSIPEAVSELIKNSGTQFDPELVKVFLKIVKGDASLNFIPGRTSTANALPSLEKKAENLRKALKDGFRNRAES